MSGNNTMFNQVTMADDEQKNSKKYSGWTIVMMVLTSVAWASWIVCRLTIGGMCDRPETAQNFTKASYLGRWYQQFVATTVPFGDDCVTATYADKDGTNIQVDNQSHTPNMQDFGNWINGPPPAGEPDRYFKAHCSDFTTGHCQVKPFLFSPWNDYKVVGYDEDQATGYSMVYGCDTFIAGAIKLDWMWVITRQANVIGSADWTSIKNKVWTQMANVLPNYNPDTFFKATISGTTEGCQYTPCTGIEVGLNGCP